MFIQKYTATANQGASKMERFLNTHTNSSSPHQATTPKARPKRPNHHAVARLCAAYSMRANCSEKWPQRCDLR